MTPEETCKMIDTVLAGEEFEYELPSRASVDFDHTGVTFFPPLHASYFDVSDPRQAREIAGALVAWADFKENRNTPKEIEAFIATIPDDTITGFPNHCIVNGDPASCGCPEHIHLAKPHPETLEGF